MVKPLESHGLKNLGPIVLPSIAILISLGALYFSWKQSNDEHSQLLLSLKPSLNFTTAPDADELPVGLNVENAGPGPATIKSVTWYVNKTPYRDVKEALGLDDFPDVHTLELEEGDTLAVGETEWLVKFSKKPRGQKEEAELDDFIDKIDHVAVKIEFYPVLGGDLYRKCSRKDWCD